MAAGGDVAGSDAVFDHDCDPCSDEHTVGAVGFCMDCEEWLCQVCFRTHRKPKPSRNHVLMTEEEIKNSTQTFKTVDKCTVKCEQHSEKRIAYFCKDHGFLGCSKCIFEGHRTCTVQNISDTSNDPATKSELQQITTILNDVVKGSKEIVTDVSDKITLVKDNKIETVEDFRKYKNELIESFNEVIECLNKLEVDLENICSETEVKETKRLEQIVDECKTIEKESLLIQNQLEGFEDKGKLCNMFVAMKTSRNKVETIMDDVKRCKGSTGVTLCTFKPTVKATEKAVEILKSLGGMFALLETRHADLSRQPTEQENMSDGCSSSRPIDVFATKNIELHRAKHAWKPAVLAHRVMELEMQRTKDAWIPVFKCKTTSDDTDDLYRKTRSILNKLTPRKFQTLVAQMQALPIDSETKLKGVIDLVFEKAISEPNFSVAYANMCRCLSMFKVPAENKPRKMLNFREVILTRCQREFEKAKPSDALLKEKTEEIPEEHDELTQELELQRNKAQRRYVGCIRFIGELFKLKMLTENIMHDCVFKLLRSMTLHIEGACQLLTTVGKELDVEKAKPRMDQYFELMQMIVNGKKISPRVRFLLQDVIDLRLNKWVPLRMVNTPKTLDQIHKEVEQEAQEEALLTQQAQLQQTQSLAAPWEEQ